MPKPALCVRSEIISFLQKVTILGITIHVSICHIMQTDTFSPKLQQCVRTDAILKQQQRKIFYHMLTPTLQVSIQQAHALFQHNLTSLPQLDIESDIILGSSCICSNNRLCC